ncbi:MAG: serine/threonine-protein kinase [Gemmatimonadota bacterium]|nr:serine/threonine-protein kinase [Gemmatimonadota bacterium]
MTLPTDDLIVRELTAAVAGHYTLERELGRGGMGAVFLARDIKLDRLVAIKVLPPELAVRPELRARFLQETRTAASFSHPNIVPVHGVEESAALLYFVMGYVEGETLTQRVRRQGPLEAAVAVRLLREVAWALSYAHGRGVVHRDIKPDNILLERGSGRALVMDFGISRSAAASGLTQVGESLGTPHYMSPEQAAGDTVDGRSDLYSLGVTAYYAVTCTLPFDAPSAQAVMAMHLSQPAPPVANRRPDLPDALTASIDRCLAKAPADRFPTGEALGEALEAVQVHRAEVPPAIRLWVSRADQFFRNGLIIAFVSFQILARSKMSQLDKMVFAAMFTAAIFALWTQIPLGLRELARLGISFPDLRTGLELLDAERAATLAARRADPGYPTRRRRLWLGLGVGFLLGTGLLIVALKQRTPVSTGGYSIGGPGVVAVFVAVTTLMATLVMMIATLAGGGKMDQRLHRLWRGAIGARLFRLGAWRLPGGAPVGGQRGTLSASARTLVEALPPEHRRAATTLKANLQHIADRIDALDRRERELAASVAEIRTPGGGTEESHKQAELQRDLDVARRSVAEERAHLLQAVESARLGLIRVRSGLGGMREVLSELAAASAIPAEKPR